MKISESRLNISDLNTFYRHGGAGKPVVLLHGVPGASYLWRKIIPLLAADFAVYAPDMPGFGSSDTPSDFELKTYAAWFAEFCRQAVGDKKISLVVHDLGGPVGLDFAIEHQEKINRLVIMDTLASFKDAKPLMKFMASPPILWLTLRLTNKKNLGRTMKSWFVHQKDKLTDEAIDHYYQFFLRDKRENIRHNIYAAWRPVIDHIVAENISRINCPTLILWAEEDFIIPFRLAKKFNDLIKGSALKTIPNCGHYFQEEEPELIASQIKEFFL